jgi:hypothetical protein
VNCCDRSPNLRVVHFAPGVVEVSFDGSHQAFRLSTSAGPQQTTLSHPVGYQTVRNKNKNQKKNKRERGEREERKRRGKKGEREKREEIKREGREFELVVLTNHTVCTLPVRIHLPHEDRGKTETKTRADQTPNFQ